MHGCLHVCVCACLCSNLIVSSVLCRLNLTDGCCSTSKNNASDSFRYGVGVHVCLYVYLHIYEQCVHTCACFPSFLKWICTVCVHMSTYILLSRACRFVFSQSLHVIWLQLIKIPSNQLLFSSLQLILHSAGA